MCVCVGVCWRVCVCGYGYLKEAVHKRHFDRIDFGSDDRNRDSRRVLLTHGSLRVEGKT